MFRYLLLSFILVIIDQISKIIAVKYLDSGKVIAIFPGLNFSLAYNEGAAFGIFANQSGWQRWFFLAVALIVIIAIVFWMLKSYKSTYKLETFSLALILSGAIGNLIDRALYGYVVDFIDFYIRDWHWYTFNIADTAICVGAFLFSCNLVFSKTTK